MSTTGGEVLTAEQTGQTIAKWLVDAIDKLGKDQADESVLFVTCRGGIFKFTVEIHRPDGPRPPTL